MGRGNRWIVGGLVLLLSVQVVWLHAAQVDESSDALHAADRVLDASCDDASSGVCLAPTNGEPAKEFVPTTEWQQVQPNQAIPPGLHVRVNLATGLKEAKLMSEEEDTEETEATSGTTSGREMLPVLVEETNQEEEPLEEQPTAKKTPIVTQLDTSTIEEAHARARMAQQQGQEELTAQDEDESADQVTAKETNWNDEKIYEVLRALPEPPQVDGLNLDDAKAKMSQQEFRRHMVSLWRKRQKELKEAMEAIQDDAKYFVSILEDFEKAKDTPSEQVRLLELLEWEVSDMDKTLIFNYVGGFDAMVDALNASDATVRANVAWLIGSAVKNYHEAQNWALDAGALPKLLNLLSLKVPLEDADSIDLVETFELKKKALYAMSAIVRGNERAQRLLLINEGIAKLEALTDEIYPLNLRIKVVLLLHDLLLEHPVVQSSPDTEPDHDPGADTNVEVSPLVQLHSVFRSSRWCQVTASVFKEVETSFKKQVLMAMLHQLPECAQDFRDAQVSSHLHATAEFWQQNRQQDKEELAEMQQLIQRVQTQL